MCCQIPSVLQHQSFCGLPATKLRGSEIDKDWGNHNTFKSKRGKWKLSRILKQFCNWFWCSNCKKQFCVKSCKHLMHFMLYSLSDLPPTPKALSCPNEHCKKVIPNHKAWSSWTIFAWNIESDTDYELLDLFVMNGTSLGRTFPCTLWGRRKEQLVITKDEVPRTSMFKGWYSWEYWLWVITDTHADSFLCLKYVHNSTFIFFCKRIFLLRECCAQASVKQKSSQEFQYFFWQRKLYDSGKHGRDIGGALTPGRHFVVLGRRTCCLFLVIGWDNFHEFLNPRKPPDRHTRNSVSICGFPQNPAWYGVLWRCGSVIRAWTLIHENVHHTPQSRIHTECSCAQIPAPSHNFPLSPAHFVIQNTDFSQISTQNS